MYHPLSIKTIACLEHNYFISRIMRGCWPCLVWSRNICSKRSPSTQRHVESDFATYTSHILAREKNKRVPPRVQEPLLSSSWLTDARATPTHRRYREGPLNSFGHCEQTSAAHRSRGGNNRVCKVSNGHTPRKPLAFRTVRAS